LPRRTAPVLQPSRGRLPVHQQPGAVRPPGADLPPPAGAGEVARGPVAMRSFLAKYWFPVALAAVLLAAVPGLCLFVLQLAGADAGFSQSLESRFHLGYRLAVPA